MTTMTDAEQLMLELVNRARLDPAGEALRYNIDLNQGLAAGTLDATAKQVLAPNDFLHTASRDHSAWMLANDVFSHTGAGGSSPGARMTAAGYSFAGSWTWGENISWRGTTGSVDTAAFIQAQHQGLFLSAGHRVNTLNGSFREIGVGAVAGDFAVGSTTYNALMVSLGFARSGSSSFVTGVIYDDNDHDAFYSLGEGRAAVRVSARPAGGTVVDSDNAAGSGGYAMAVSGTSGKFDVTFAGGGLAAAVTVTLTLAGLNAKLDLVDGLTVRASVDVALKLGARHIELLGIEDIDAIGNAAANQLSGNAGANLLAGAGANDNLQGNGGNDTLNGGAGDDLLNGGPGSDRMAGGIGNDGYTVNVGGDAVVEGEGNGVDTVRSSVTLALPRNVENLTLIAAGAVDGSGNALANAIVGGSGNNQLDGLGGSDTLTGGAGADRFVFSTAPGAGNIDRIADFDVSADLLVLEDAVFAGLGVPGVLAASAFGLGAGAGDASDRVIYDAATGALFYDVDGNGAQAPLAIAWLAPGLALSAADILVA